MRTFKAYQLSLHFYKNCTEVKLPRHLQDQLLRASSSICLNLAEGSARRTPRDRRKFYNIAQAFFRGSSD